MVDVDKWSDAELRSKLIEYGFPLMPITGTTRKVMVKKLRLLMDNKKKIGSDGRRSLGRYSSEEESDTDVVKPTKREKNKRTTMAVMQPPKSVSKKQSRIIDDTSSNESTRRTRDIKVASTRTTRLVKAAQDEFDTGSDSESEITEETTHVYNNHETRKPSPVKSSSLFTSRYSPTKSNSFTDNSYSQNSTSNYGNRFTTSFNTQSDAGERLNQIRSRLSLGSPSYSTYTPSKPIDTSETPFLSNFTRNLSQLSASNLTSDYDYKNDVIKEHDVNGASSYSRNYRSPRFSRNANISREFQTRQEKNILKNNLVSFTLIGVAFLFFIIISLTYMGMRSDGSSLETSGYVIPYCIKTDPKSRKGVNCVVDSDVISAINILKVIKPELYKKAVSNRCEDSNIKPYMTESEIVNFIKVNYALNDERVIQNDLANMEILSFVNPLWELSVLQIDSDARDVSESNKVDNMDQIILNKDSKVTAIAVLNPSVPLKCSFYNKLYAILNTVAFLLGGFTLLYTINKSVKYYKYYVQKQRDEIFLMVERIVDMLQTNSSEGGDNYLVINHVRDMILPINNRKGKEAIWKHAVKFINENESRVRTEIQVVQGEPYEVWRWLGGANLNTSGSPRTKTWQGQAFETEVGSVNSLPCSPTPCLKIRGMVEDGDKNLHTIREAVLSKCAHQCRILHCAVDTNSNCVYLKCADPADAAIAYRNLHGWWYAGHLVTVKYLRLERYMQRFPESPVNGPPYVKAITPAADWSN